MTQQLPRLGWWVVSREYVGGGISAVVYVNRTSAVRAAARLNASAPADLGTWEVRQGTLSRMFFVCWVATIVPAETAFEVTERALAAEEACADWHEVL